MKKLLLLTLFFLLSSPLQASRLLEVEDYYVKKATEFVKSRYPRSAFSVYIKVEADETPRARELASSNEQRLLNLPYMDPVGRHEIDFWDRKDLSLGMLISYLKSVSVQLDIDQDFSESEMELFKTEIFKYLKLSDKYDRVEIKERFWSKSGAWYKLTPASLAILFGLLTGLVALFFIFQSSVNRLVKGLIQPLSAIGKSAEDVVNSSHLTGGSAASTISNLGWQESEQLSIQAFEKAKSEIQKILPFLQEAPAELLHKLEELGSRDPFAMGALFQEVPVADLKNLVVWAKGGWWRTALTEITPMTRTSVQFLNQLSKVHIRFSLKTNTSSTDLENLKRGLFRLQTKEFGQLLSDVKFDEAQPILSLLPQETMIEVGKYLYPGEWAKLLEESTETPELSQKKIGQFYQKALEISPLKSDGEIANYFKDADLLALLNRSSTRNEREIYRALSDKSWLRMNRTPFYEVFQASADVLSPLATNLPLEVWALATMDCDRQECETVFQYFSDKQRYMMRSYKKKFQDKTPNIEAKVQAKKQVLAVFHQLTVGLSAKESHAKVAA